MSVKDEAIKLRKNIDLVYRAFWDLVTDKNTRTNYNRAFYYWNCEYMRPPYKIVPTNEQSGLHTFAYNKSLKKIEKAHFDFSKKATAANSNASWQNTFDNCENLEEIEDIGLKAQYGYSFTFRTCRKLHTIAKIGTDENTTWSSAFANCEKLKNITIDGIIGKKGFNVQGCPLTHDSLTSIINALKDFGAVKVFDGSYTLPSSESLAEVTLSENVVKESVTISNIVVVGDAGEMFYLENITDNGDGSFVDETHGELGTIDYVTGKITITVVNAYIPPLTTITYKYSVRETSSEVLTVTFGSTNIAKLTSDELAIISSKGWSYQ